MATTVETPPTQAAPEATRAERPEATADVPPLHNGDRLTRAEFDWFALEDERYVRLPPGEDGQIRSRAFPGLHLDAQALLDGDGAAVLGAVRAGTETDAHAAFARELHERRGADG